MNIQMAVKKAIDHNGYIARRKCEDDKSFRVTRIKPTNSYATCIVFTFDQEGKRIASCKNWNPTADDLMAEDWKVFKE